MIQLEAVALIIEAQSHCAFFTCRVTVASSALCTATTLLCFLWPVSNCIELHLWRRAFSCLLPGWLDFRLLLKGRSPMLAAGFCVCTNQSRFHMGLELSSLQDLLRRYAQQTTVSAVYTSQALMTATVTVCHNRYIDLS